MSITKISFRSILGLLLAGVVTAHAAEDNTGPELTHIPSAIGYRALPVPVYVKVEPNVDGLGISRVELHVAENPEDTTTLIPMAESRESHYHTVIPANLLGGRDQIWYYIAAYDSMTNLTQSEWYPVAIQDPDQQSSDPKEAPEVGRTGSGGTDIPADEITGVSYGGIGAKEIGIGAGAVVGAAVIYEALSGGGGGSGFDDSNVISVPSAGSSSGSFSSAPQDRVIDGTSEVDGNSIQAVRVTVDYEAFNIPDQFQIIYEGSVIGDTGVVSGNGSFQGVGNGSSPVVIIRVITPQGGTAWNWQATVEYSILVPAEE